MATVANQEVTSILTRMIGQEIRLTQQGFRTRSPIDGFKNQKVFIDGKKKTIQVPDPDRAPFYKRIFELRSGGLSDIQIVGQLNNIGYRTPLRNRYNKDHTKIIGHIGGNLLTVKQLQRVIANTVYAGVLCEKWTFYKPVRAQYDGLVTIDLFNLANRGKIVLGITNGIVTLTRNSTNSPVRVNRNIDNPEFAYRFIVCPYCGKYFKGSFSTGKSGNKFPAYHCAYGHARIGINKKDFETTVNEYVQKLKFDTTLEQSFEAVIWDLAEKRKCEIARSAEAMTWNINELRIEQAAKMEAFVAANSPLIRQKLEKEIEQLEDRIQNAGTETAKMQLTDADIRTFLNAVRKIVQHPWKMLLNPRNIRVKRLLYGLVFEEPPTYHDILNGTPKLSFIFRQLQASPYQQIPLVTPAFLDWNQLEKTIEQWKYLLSTISPEYFDTPGLLAA